MNGWVNFSGAQAMSSKNKYQLFIVYTVPMAMMQLGKMESTID